MTIALRSLAVALALLCLSGAAFAQTAARTNVSAHGVDSGTCSATTPCRTFEYAFSQTVAGGEIDVLDSANYGPVTITRTVSINGNNGVGGITVPPGRSGVKVVAGAGSVILRGLSINGDHRNDTLGVEIDGGTLVFIEGCYITGTDSGVFLFPKTTKLILKNSNISQNNYGVFNQGQVGDNLLLSHNEISGNQIGTYFSFQTDKDNDFFANVLADSISSTMIPHQQY